MRQLSLWLGLCAIFIVGTVNLSAQPAVVGSVTFTDQEYGAGAYLGGVVCPQGTCGYAPGSGAETLGQPSATGTAITSGWHNYAPPKTGTTNTSSQTYLNNLEICSVASGDCGTQKLGFTLTGKAALNIGPPAGTPVSLFRAPAGDAGYFLSTPGADTITITPPSGYYFNTFGFYWGSIDPWNAVIFTPNSGTATTVFGTNLSAYDSNISITDPGATCTTAACANADTATVVFTPTCTTTSTTTTCDPNWTSIEFQACDFGGCFPAFEFDNLQFDLTTCTSGYNGPTGACTNSVSPAFESALESQFKSSPTPEPSSLLLLGPGIAGIATLLRRKLRS